MEVVKFSLPAKLLYEFVKIMLERYLLLFAVYERVSESTKQFHLLFPIS